MRRYLMLASALTALLVALLVAGPAAASNNARNWHIHDGLAEPGHAPIGFFPSILGVSTAQYLLDPAVCPNATDKVLLGPDGVDANQVAGRLAPRAGGLAVRWNLRRSEYLRQAHRAAVVRAGTRNGRHGRFG
jgi:hypothetical protein